MHIFHRTMVVVSVSTGLLILAGCPSTNPTNGFPGGVRIFSTESLANIPNSDFPVPGATYNGYQYGQVGNGNTGVYGSVSGVTGPGGIADNPKAITDSYWSMSASVATVLPVCPNTATSTMYIPPTGGVFDFNCFQGLS